MGTVNINGKVYHGNSVSVINNRVIVDGVDVTDQSSDVKYDQIVIAGDVASLKTDLSVRVEGSAGNIDAGGSVKCKNVNGDVSAAGSISCCSVGGDVRAGGSAKCGNVNGHIKAGGSVKHR